MVVSSSTPLRVTDGITKGETGSLFYSNNSIAKNSKVLVLAILIFPNPRTLMTFFGFKGSVLSIVA